MGDYVRQKFHHTYFQEILCNLFNNILPMVWPCGLEQNKKHYQYYKSFLAVLFPVLFIYGIILQNHNSINYDEDFHYEDYVSNWNELQCCIWAFIHCYLVLVQSKSTFYRVIRQVGIGLNFSCLTTSIAIALTYWCLLPADRHEYNINALHQHGFLFLITAVDFILSTARIRWFYIVFGWIFAGSYGFYVYTRKTKILDLAKEKWFNSV